MEFDLEYTGRRANGADGYQDQSVEAEASALPGDRRKGPLFGSSPERKVLMAVSPTPPTHVAVLRFQNRNQDNSIDELSALVPYAIGDHLTEASHPTDAHALVVVPVLSSVALKNPNARQVKKALGGANSNFRQAGNLLVLRTKLPPSSPCRAIANKRSFGSQRLSETVHRTTPGTIRTFSRSCAAIPDTRKY